MAKIVGEGEIQALIHEVYSSVLYGHDYKEEHKMVLRNKDDEIVEPESRKKFIALCRDRNTFSKNSDNWKRAMQAYGPHRDFGAPMPPGSAQSSAIWGFRASLAFYNLVSYLLDCEELEASLNRVFLNMATTGSAEFVHQDGPDFSKEIMQGLQKDSHFVPDAKSEKNLEKIQELSMARPGLGGKCFAQQGSFLLAPGTHTEEFNGLVHENYLANSNYTLKPNCAIFTLKPEKPDPLGIYQKLRKLYVKEGHVIIWHPRLWHAKQTVEHTTSGCFIDLHKAGAHPAYKKRCGVDEVEDRKRSRLDGLFPLLFPSGSKTSQYHSGMPGKFYNFPDKMDRYFNKLRDFDEDGVPNPNKTKRLSIARTKRLRQEQKDLGNPNYANLEYYENAVHFTSPKGYQPPVLTKLGRLIDGQDQWPSSLP
jgi:hypothetical protein